MVVLRNKTIWQNKITDCIIDYVSFIYGSGYNTNNKRYYFLALQCYIELLLLLVLEQKE